MRDGSLAFSKKSNSFHHHGMCEGIRLSKASMQSTGDPSLMLFACQEIVLYTRSVLGLGRCWNQCSSHSRAPGADSLYQSCSKTQNAKPPNAKRKSDAGSIFGRGSCGEGAPCSKSSCSDHKACGWVAHPMHPLLTFHRQTHRCSGCELGASLTQAQWYERHPLSERCSSSTDTHQSSRLRFVRRMAAPPARNRQFGIRKERSFPKYQFCKARSRKWECAGSGH